MATKKKKGSSPKTFVGSIPILPDSFTNQIPKPKELWVRSGVGNSINGTSVLFDESLLNQNFIIQHVHIRSGSAVGASFNLSDGTTTGCKFLTWRISDVDQPSIDVDFGAAPLILNRRARLSLVDFAANPYTYCIFGYLEGVV